MESATPDELPTSFATIREAIDALGPKTAFDRLIAENDKTILSSNLSNGRIITRARSAIYHGLMLHWAERRHRELGYDRPFAVVALGGTGRDEITPCSDTDYAFLFDDSIEDNSFLRELQRETIHTREFREEYGFDGEILPFNFDDIADLDDKQLNSFGDMKPIYDPSGLAPRFRNRIQESYDPFEHFLFVSRAWRDSWGELGSKAEQVDSYNIKSDGLRVFLAAIWTLAGETFCHSHEIYEQLEDARVLDAYHFLLRLRAFVHLNKGTHTAPRADGSHLEDELSFEDFLSLEKLAGEESSEKARFEFANDVRARLMTHRKRIDQFTWGVIGGQLQRGRAIRPGSGIVLGTGGLRDTAEDRVTAWDRSRAALMLLVASQRYGTPIDPYSMRTSFRQAGDWLVQVPELSTLFYEPSGSLADSLKFLSQIPGAMARLFPGYDHFECSIDERVLTEQKCLRGAMVREKLRALESMIEEGQAIVNAAINPNALENPGAETSTSVEAALLDDSQLAAIRLALTTKRLPLTPDDLQDRTDTSLPLYDRYSSGFSGLPLGEYYRDSFRDCGFDGETLSMVEFLVHQRAAFKVCSASDLTSEEQVAKLLQCCEGDEGLLRTLYVFTICDRSGWKSEASSPARWFNIHQLYDKVRMALRPQYDPTEPLSRSGFDAEQMELFHDFGTDFLQGRYRLQVMKFASYLFRLKEDEEFALPPRVLPLRIGTSEIIGIACHDYPGIAATISGALSESGIQLSQARLFSANNHGLALNLYHVLPGQDISEVAPVITEAIQKRDFISPEHEDSVPKVADKVSIEPISEQLYRIRAATQVGQVSQLLYFLTYQAYRSLGANLRTLGANTTNQQAHVTVTIVLPTGITAEHAEEVVSGWGVGAG